MSNEEALSPTQELIYAAIREDLEQIKKYEDKAKGAKSRHSATYYGKKLAKLKGRVISTLKYAEQFNARKKVVSDEINTSREKSALILPENKIILPE